MNFRKFTLAAMLAGLCSPVLAQNAPPSDVPATPTPASPESSAPAPAQAPTAPDAAAQAPSSPSAIVDREFAVYDVNKDGKLDAAEFSSWVVKLRKPAADGSQPADSQSWSASLFARADTDHDQSVSKTEMTSLLAAAARG